MADEIIGGIGVTIGADYQPLLQQMAAAEGAAREGGESISGALGEGLMAGKGLVDQYGKAIQSSIAIPSASAKIAVDDLAKAIGREVSAAMAAVPANDDVAHSLDRVATSGHRAVTELQATSGALRVAEGSGGLRAAERFLTTLPGVGQALLAAFPVVGAIALTEMLAKMVKEVVNLTDNFLHLKDVEEDVMKTALALADGAEQAFLQAADLTADHLDALGKNVDAARMKLQNLASVPIKVPGQPDFAKISGMMGLDYQNLNKVKQAYAEVIPAELPQRINQVKENLEKLNAEVAKEKSQTVIDPFTAHINAQDEKTKEYLENALQFLETAQQRYQAQVVQGQDRITSAFKTEGDRAAAEARKATEALAKGDEDGLVQLKLSHQMTIAETMAYWKTRLEVESGNVERVRSIQSTLASLTQESDRAIMEGAKHGEEILKEQERKAKDFTAKMAALAHEAEDLGERLWAESLKRAEDIQKAQNEQGASDKETQVLEQKLKLQTAYAVEVSHTTAQEEAYQEALKKNADQLAQIKVDEATAMLQAAQEDGDSVKIAQAKLALEKAINAEKLRQLDITAKQAVEDAQNSIKGRVTAGLGDTGFTDTKNLVSAQLMVGAVDGISQALAQAVFHGKDLGKVFGNLGKQLAMQAITASLKAGFGSALKAILQLVPGFQAVSTAQSAAATEGKAVTSANNVASVTSYAAVAAAAAAAAVAGIPIVGPALAVAAAATTFADVDAYAGLAAFEYGGRPNVGEAAWVGERGKELFVPDVPGTIVPNSALRKGAGTSGTSSGSGASGSQVNHFHVMTNSPRQTAREISTFIKSQTPKYAPYSTN